MKRKIALSLAMLSFTAYSFAQTTTKPTGAMPVTVNHFRVPSTDSVYMYIPGPNKYYGVARISDLFKKVDKVVGFGLSSNDYTGAEKSKLAGIQNLATANQTDAYLLSRANHTGTQAQSTVTNLVVDLASKALDANVLHKTGNENKTGNLNINGDLSVTRIGVGISPSLVPFQVKLGTDQNVSMLSIAGVPTIVGSTDAVSSAPLKIAGSPLSLTGSGGAGLSAIDIDVNGRVSLGLNSPPTNNSIFEIKGIQLLKRYNPVFTEYQRTDLPTNAKVSVGMLGAPEANLSFNMDYTDGVHRYYDNTLGATWLAIHEDGGAMQYAPSMASDDIWNNSGQKYAWRWLNNGRFFINSSLGDISTQGTAQLVLKRSGGNASIGGVGDLIIDGETNPSTTANITLQGYNNGNVYLTPKTGGGRTIVGAYVDDGTTKFQINGDAKITGNLNSNRVTVNLAPSNPNDAVRLQDISITSSGTYTPTISNTLNISSSTTKLCLYSRVGNIVTYSGVVSVTTPATGLTQFELTLPISSSFNSVLDAAGTSTGNASNFFTLKSNSSSSGKIFLGFSSSSGGITPQDIYFNCQYIIK